MKGPLQDWINKRKAELAQKKTGPKLTYVDEKTMHNFTDKELIEMLKKLPKVIKK